MKTGEDVPQRRPVHTRWTLAAAELAKALADGFPHHAGAFVRLLVNRWRVLLVLVGAVVQVVLVLLVWELVDLSVALMEVWAELARKHLEIVLS